LKHLAAKAHFWNSYFCAAQRFRLYLESQTLHLHEVAVSSVRGLPKNTLEAALVKKEAAERAKVIQNPAACGHMAHKLCKVEVNELKGLDAAFRIVCPGQRDVGLHLGQRILNGIREQANVLVGTLDVIERSLGTMTTHSAVLPMRINAISISLHPKAAEATGISGVPHQLSASPNAILRDSNLP